ncbi:hypothetical protein ACFQ3Z_04250 [Streptomyces nogalater]
MSFERGDALLRLNQTTADRPSSFRLLGREWDLLEGVFAPVYCFSTRLFASWIAYPEEAASWRSARAPVSWPSRRRSAAAPG